jgi:pyruvate-formate lyase-activating enzyme
MKFLKMMVAAVALSTVSFGAMSAKLLTEEELNKNPSQYEKVGNITTSGEADQMDANEELSKKADEKGGDFYVLTSADTDKKIHATADVYKKK